MSLKTPSFSLKRDGYKFVLSFGNIDKKVTDSKKGRNGKIWIQREVYEKQDKTKKGKWDSKKSDNKKESISASRSSWTYSLNKYAYYPYVSDGNNDRQSDLKQRISKIVFKVWIEWEERYKIVTPGGQHAGYGYRKRKSKTTTKTYTFDAAVKPTVAISYTEDGTKLSYSVDMNDDYGIDDNTKKVTTRTWVWLTRDTKSDGKKAVKVSGHSGKWYDRDTVKTVQNKELAIRLDGYIPEGASLDTKPKPVKYTIHAYSAGPGGKSQTAEKYHIFARPLTPLAPTFKRLSLSKNKTTGTDCNNGLYEVHWKIDTNSGWNPVDKVTILYRDQTEHKGASDIYHEDMGSWSTAKDNINSSIRRIMTDDIGVVGNDKVRYFKILVEHDGLKVPSYLSDVVDYGVPSEVTPTVQYETIYDSDGNQREVPVFSWSEPASKLFNTTGPKEERLRIKIFDQTSSECINTIYYGDPEWTDRKWTYSKYNKKTRVNFGFQVRIGKDNTKDGPGARSNITWISLDPIPSKCTNVQGTKLANNTTVNVSWNNPVTEDTVSNGIEVAWSTYPNVWETNSSPSTATFDNGALESVFITGLSAGSLYYFWVRRYEKNGDSTVYGLWSDPSEGVLLADIPDKPILTLSRSWIKEGGSLSAQWIYYASAGTPQTNAAIVINDDDTTWGTETEKTIASISGEDDHCNLNLSEFPAKETPYYLRVLVMNSVGVSVSDSVELNIAVPPTCELTSSSIVDYECETTLSDTDAEQTETVTVKALRSMPFNINATGNGDLDLYIYCVDNFNFEHPDKTNTIFGGDCIWSSSIEEGDYTIEDVKLADNCRYRVQLECTDPDTGLTAEPRFIDFEVHWEHQAIEPEDSTVSISDGVATLKPVKPLDALDTDVCDIYRSTSDGRYLCKEGVSWGQTVVDILPTFGSGFSPSYCFCTRTKDGDEAWVDIEYELDGSGIIINYGNESIALPWNVKIDDSRSKKGEVRQHLGGTKSYFSQPFVDRTQSINTDIIKIENEDLVEQLYDLSRYTELCYIRASNGIGYPAMVDVSLSREYNNNIVGVSLSVTETDAVGEFQGTIV